MSTRFRVPFLRRCLVPLATSAALAAFALPVRAEDGEGESAASIEQQIKAQMEKILQLMRENQKAILEASLGSKQKPEGVDVVPPQPPEQPGGAPSGHDGGMAGGTPPPAGAGMDGGAPPAVRGDDIRRRIEEVIKTTSEKGGAIPNELEELVRMIPTKGGGSGGGGGGGDAQKRDMPRPDDPQPDPQAKQDPKDGQKPREKPDENQPPPKAETGDPLDAGIATWFAELPEQDRQAIISGSADRIPPKYRARIAKYLEYLAKKARERR